MGRNWIILTATVWLTPSPVLYGMFARYPPIKVLFPLHQAPHGCKKSSTVSSMAQGLQNAAISHCMRYSPIWKYHYLENVMVWRPSKHFPNLALLRHIFQPATSKDNSRASQLVPNLSLSCGTQKTFLHLTIISTSHGQVISLTPKAGTISLGCSKKNGCAMEIVVTTCWVGGTTETTLVF